MLIRQSSDKVLSPGAQSRYYITVLQIIGSDISIQDYGWLGLVMVSFCIYCLYIQLVFYYTDLGRIPLGSYKRNPSNFFR